MCELGDAVLGAQSHDSRRGWGEGWGAGRKDGLHPRAGLFPRVAPSTTLFCPSIVHSCLCIQPHKMHRFFSLCFLSFGPGPVYTVLDPTSIQMTPDNTAFLWVPGPLTRPPLALLKPRPSCLLQTSTWRLRVFPQSHFFGALLQHI